MPAPTTPCVACATQAAAKPGSFWATRGLDWPTTEVAGRTVHRACAGEAEYLVAHAGDIAVNDDGVARWTTSGRVIPADTAALIDALGLAPGLDVEATRTAGWAETQQFLQAYRDSQPAEASAEERAGMLAAFGPGVKVVDVITGRETQL